MSAMLVLSAGIVLELIVSWWLPFPRMDPSLLQPPFEEDDLNTHAFRARIRMTFAKLDGEGSQATIELTENGRKLGPANSARADVNHEGQGRYRFIADTVSQIVIFSTSDNSDPNTNGRVYRAFDPKIVDPYAQGSGK